MERKVFLFTNVTGAAGREIPVVTGALAGNAAIYSVGMGVPVETSANAGRTPSPIRSRR